MESTLRPIEKEKQNNKNEREKVEFLRVKNGYLDYRQSYEYYGR